jgi:hypothetical protein
MKLSLIIISFALLGTASQTFYDHSVVLGPPMKEVVMQGDYVAAVDAAYQLWLSGKPGSMSISRQKVTVSAEPGMPLLYVRFSMLKPSAPGMIDDCDSRLYAFDTQKREVVWKDRCGQNHHLSDEMNAARPSPSPRS